MGQGDTEKGYTPTFLIEDGTRRKECTNGIMYKAMCTTLMRLMERYHSIPTYIQECVYVIITNACCSAPSGKIYLDTSGSYTGCRVPIKYKLAPPTYKVETTLPSTSSLLHCCNIGQFGSTLRRTVCTDWDEQAGIPCTYAAAPTVWNCLSRTPLLNSAVNNVSLHSCHVQARLHLLRDYGA